MEWTLNQIKADLRLLAIKAMSEIEHQARVLLATEGQKLLGAEKRQLAVSAVMQGYAALTVNIPVLNATQIDDHLVRRWAEEAVDWACEQLCDVINKLGRTPVVGAPELQPARVEDAQ
ncbi:hypothetical protein [Deinococcus misasensis]|uniref:hypothetical protein n=1 Tax=Deinococcus misasensis TaxID=392413 RepID=UPI00054E2285|nr:hypothetical protein [Deinococcus misasensis]